MAFREFQFPQVLRDLGLTARDADLFDDAPPMAVRPGFAAFLTTGVAVAQANSTEKAKSDFVIGPVLLELRHVLGDRFNLFSGMEWNPAPERGLNGSCDFILTRGPSQHILESPFAAIAEAKNDLTHTGLGQCIAGMFAAQLVNEQSGQPPPAVYGVVSTGTAWLFLQLSGSVVLVGRREYFITDLPKVMGVLRQIVCGG